MKKSTQLKVHSDNTISNSTSEKIHTCLSKHGEKSWCV